MQSATDHRMVDFLACLLRRHCEKCRFVIHQVGPATFEAIFTKAVRLQPGRIANVLGGDAELEDDTILINGCEIELRLVARG